MGDDKGLRSFLNRSSVSPSSCTYLYSERRQNLFTDADDGYWSAGELTAMRLDEIPAEDSEDSEDSDTPNVPTTVDNFEGAMPSPRQAKTNSGLSNDKSLTMQVDVPNTGKEKPTMTFRDNVLGYSQARSSRKSSSSRESSNSDTRTRPRTRSSTTSSENGPVLPWHVPIVNTPPVPFAQISPHYDLPCEFAFLGCEVVFHPNRFGKWINHSLSHFARAGPPRKATCIFCDLKDGIFDCRNRSLNWRNRMHHIAEHYERGEQYEKTRLDFFVIEHMNTNGLLSAEDLNGLYSIPNDRSARA